MAKEFKRNSTKEDKGRKMGGVKKGFKKTGFKKDKTTEKLPYENENVLEEKKTASKKPFNKHSSSKPAFERYRDDSRPSDFGNSRKPKPSFDKKNTEKAPFKKNNSAEKPKIKRGDNLDSTPFRDKKEKSKTPFKKTKGTINPYDLDASDLKYENDDKKTTFNKPKPTKYTKKPYEKKTYSSSKKKSVSKPEREVDDGLIRLNKYIANAGICSRREADTLIETGVVQVNGKTITEMGYRVKPTDIIKYGGQVLKKERMVYLVLNKPKDYITTVDDPQKRRTVLELVQGACRERIYPVGRLDRATTGLLLFTNDGDLTKKLTHPKYGVRKIYHVELDKPLKNIDINKITEGLELEDGLIKVDEVSYVGNAADKTQIGIEIHSGKNRIVRRIFEHLGYNVRKLDRVMFGSLTKKDLSRGRWRLLSDAEVGMLKMISAE